LREEGSWLVVLAADAAREDLATEISFALGREVRVIPGDPDELRTLLRRHFGGGDAATHDDAGSRVQVSTAVAADAPLREDLAGIAARAPVVQFVNQVLSRAIAERASDIHFEPFERDFRVRCRVDGTLREFEAPSLAMALPVTSRLKVMANLDIAERRVPQDGRIQIRQEGKDVDLRVSTLPTQFGESVVLRVLDQSAVKLDLADLGLPEPILTGLNRVIRRPAGIVLVTGPTGSGKTTTLYSALRAINTPDVKLLTIEDPVEYEVEGVRQVPVNLAAGLTFSSALRSFLRHDPDVIMVGEIRDVETAQIGIQAALTGHLVLSTLHTNDAPSAATRLVDMGVEPFLLASTIEAVLAQRLVRKICQECLESDRPSAALRDQFGLRREPAGPHEFLRGAGCSACHGTGYRGRMGIFEWLELDEELRKLILERAPAEVLRDKAAGKGMRSLRQEGLKAVFAGLTSLEEVASHV
jgi:type IV pilus assembly protein PilB